ncbi:MAG: MFS transporter [Candidatus Omnitrophota bacterium]
MRNKRLFWVFALSSSVYFTQGIETLPSQSLFYYLKETLGFSPEKIMVISSIITFAWLVKPVIGYVVDNFLNKRGWIFISLVLSAIFVLILGLNHLPLAILVAFLLIHGAFAAFRDVSADGIMCVEGKKHNATGRIQSIQWMSISVATLLTGIGGGYIAEKWGYKAGFLWLIPFYAIAGVFAYFYKADDEARAAREAHPKAPTTLLRDLKKIFGDKRLLIAGLFVFLYRYSPSFGTPLFFIQRDTFKWSKLWIGSLGTLATIFTIAGALLYYKFSQRINIKKWLYVSVFLGAVTTLSYLYYTPVTAIIYDVVYGLVGMFIFLMLLDFMARNSVKGLEAASFALLCSLSNLALVTSNLSGAFLLPMIGLNGLIILSSFTSFLCLFLIERITYV